MKRNVVLIGVSGFQGTYYGDECPRTFTFFNFNTGEIKKFYSVRWHELPEDYRPNYTVDSIWQKVEYELIPYLGACHVRTGCDIGEGAMYMKKIHSIDCGNGILPYNFVSYVDHGEGTYRERTNVFRYMKDNGVLPKDLLIDGEIRIPLHSNNHKVACWKVLKSGLDGRIARLKLM